jgi:hypothetical protein
MLQNEPCLHSGPWGVIEILEVKLSDFNEKSLKTKTKRKENA